MEATQDNAGTFDAGDLENMLAVADAVRQENQSADDTLPAMPDATDTATEVRVHRVSTSSATPEPKFPSGTADGEDSDSTESSTRVQVANRRSERSPNQQRIDRFLIRKELGGGQFGIVFRADDTRLKRSVALKILRLDRRNPRQLRRFETEARSAAKLHHPNIVAVYENGMTTDGTRYLVCEFVDGRDLKAIIAAGHTSVREFVTWVRDLALALAYAHSEGIIHRDIKPANILVDDVTRRPKLADFGLAKVLRPDEEPADAALETRDGILGTVAFMAPEQARGELDNLGPLSDQYSLGAVLYQCLT
ncbi:MAG: serine/threonine protein kinase, partial [Planctomycetaceae bacterium]|nr:serine/threonine protein kinase [Planctomycetaceae bacterium]